MIKINEIDKPELSNPLFMGLPYEKEIKIHSYNYKIFIDDYSEFGMSNYFYLTNILKNGELIFKEYIKEFGINALITDDERFIFLPTMEAFKIIDLLSGKESIILQRKNGNFIFSKHQLAQFDLSNKFLLLDKWEEGYKVIDLERRKIITNSNISNVHFGNDDLVWNINQIESGCYLNRFNFNNKSRTRSKIPSPYEYFNIEEYKIPDFSIKDDSNDNNNLYSDEYDGLLHFSLLNNWKYYDDDSRNIYSTFIPTGKKLFNTNWEQTVFEVEKKYVQFNP